MAYLCIDIPVHDISVYDMPVNDIAVNDMSVYDISVYAIYLISCISCIWGERWDREGEGVSVTGVGEAAAVV